MEKGNTGQEKWTCCAPNADSLGTIRSRCQTLDSLIQFSFHNTRS